MLRKFSGLRKSQNSHYMGNMGNTLLNRWGVNTFWQHFWYADKYYSKKIQQDEIFIKLINIYLYFGLESSKSFFFNNYWFSNLSFSSNQWRYFRFAKHRHHLTSSSTIYRLRVGPSDVLPMKIWLLRYDRWLIINAYWFQPTKKKRKKLIVFKKHPFDSYHYKAKSPKNILKRLRSFYIYSFFNKWSPNHRFF
jgi:hypothetical protein